MKKRICSHDKPANTRDSILFRCACGNVWMSGTFFGSLPKDQSAASILGAFKLKVPAGTKP